MIDSISYTRGRIVSNANLNEAPQAIAEVLQRCKRVGSKNVYCLFSLRDFSCKAKDALLKALFAYNGSGGGGGIQKLRSQTYPGGRGQQQNKG